MSDSPRECLTEPLEWADLGRSSMFKFIPAMTKKMRVG
jgi:hypothetical protein